MQAILGLMGGAWVRVPMLAVLRRGQHGALNRGLAHLAIVFSISTQQRRLAAELCRNS